VIERCATSVRLGSRVAPPHLGPASGPSGTYRSMASMATPPRPLPGTWQQTPAPRPPPAPSFQSSQGARSPFAPNTVPSTGFITRPSQTPSQPPQQATTTAPAATQTLTVAERAARTINETLAGEARFPELDSYLAQGLSAEYDIQSSAPWAPFQKVRIYNIPDQIFEQYNRAQVSTSMGLFAELHYAWVAIDNALYMWDYTIPNPELLGFEGQPNSITAVKLAVPRSGVFLPTIQNIIVLATTAEVMLLGLGTEQGPGGTDTVELFDTGMTVSVKGLDITVIAFSAKSGRIFFGGRTENEVYELTYQQEDKWFSSRCAKVCHTSSALASFGVSLPFSQKPTEYVEQMVVDDTRDLLYTLSSKSAIRVFHMTSTGDLTLAITKSAANTYSNVVGFSINASETFNAAIKIISISPIPAQEASRYHLVATTETGYRIYLSATSSNTWSSSATGTPINMQAQHVKTPPLNPAASLSQPGSGISPSVADQGSAQHQPVRSLRPSRMAARFPPGYFFCFVSREPNQAADTLFVSAPDAARLARPPETGQPSKSSESATWLSLGSRAEDIGLCTPYSAPTTTPTGFGNEIAVQFDTSVPDVAILTNTGVHIVRRRRLVDIFAALIQSGGGSEGVEGEIKNFIRSYGRTETLATALAVACGQGMEVAPDSRVARINDPDVLEVARRAFIEYGGKPTINQNSIAEQNTPAIDSVRPSPRHGGIALYLSRLIRSTWNVPIAKEVRTPQEYKILPAVPIEKLKSVQEDLSALQRFFQANKTFIKGLSGPDTLSRPGTTQEEVALQGEHRSLHSLVKFVSDTIEGISFVLVLFDERVEEIVPLLPEPSRPQILQLTFEQLFSTQKGFELAKELVKAIVNRNIAKGSNVETVAEALRRRCGSFCSAQDVVIFKAQEQLKRASEAGANAEYKRNLLNESLNLFQQVAEKLPRDYLESAVKQFTDLQFYAGAIQLVLSVAKESDKGNEALSWIADGRPEPDPRKAKFEYRSQCYDLLHDVVNAVDKSSAQDPLFIDGRPTVTATRRNEAYDVISRSTDEVFLTNLYDWYLEQGWYERLLQTNSPFIVTYLQRRSAEDVTHADLLWKYYAQANQFYDAACVQLQLARSGFNLPLDRRIEYLSRARANASTYTQGGSRKSKQRLLQEITEFLDVANIQDEILQRLKEDTRLTPEGRQEVLADVDGPILTITEVCKPLRWGTWDMFLPLITL
jgi:nuclear pore complex protein Nup155